MNIDERSSMKAWEESGRGGEYHEDSRRHEHANNGGNREGYSHGRASHGESDGRADEYRDRVRGRDAARISTLMGSGTYQGAELPGASIPLPEFSDDSDVGDHGSAVESGAMTLEGYQRIRKGYERGINPEALEQMEERQNAMRQFPPPAPSYAESTRLQSGPVPVTGAVNGLYKPEEAEETGYQREQQYERYEEYPEPESVTSVTSSRRFGPIAVTLLLFVGIVGGLLLYVGGADLVAGLFRSGQTEPEENLTLVTERPGATNQESSVGLPIAGDPADDDMGEAMEEDAADESEAISDDGEVEGDAAAEEREELERQRAAEEAKRKEEEARRAKAAAEKRAAEERAREQAAREKAEAAKRAAAQDVATETSGSEAKSNDRPSVRPISSSGGSWVVQVRATTDKAEADRIARTLRSKGGDDVHIIATEKDGGTLYRVRFGDFDSQEGAKRIAGNYGFSDVWVMKR